MNVELINTGSELLLGRVLNSHQRWLCRRLADLGMVVTRQVSVADTGEAIGEAVSDALRRADLVITTGGLGPTSDDLTRDRIADLLKRPLNEDATIRVRIEEYFRGRGRPAPARVMVQAMVPAGAVILPNLHGTAPGLALDIGAGAFRPDRSWLVMLPGPPRELYPMFDASVIPLLREQWPGLQTFHCLTLRTTGLGESRVEERLAAVLQPWLERGVELGYCARSGEVDIRLTARGDQGAALVAEAECIVRERLGDFVFGTGEDSLESVVIQLARAQGARLACAESCTGGLLGHRLTNVPGASRVFWGGWVTYDNAAKAEQLGVPAGLLAEHGAVSEACALAMAEGALRHAGTDHALAITGIAGPDGGTPDKPVGTVFVGLVSTGRPPWVRRFLNPCDRETFKHVATQHALDMLRRRLLASDDSTMDS